jgi:bacterioferritin
MGPFAIKLAEVKRRAREHMENGAVTAGYKANREEVIKVLNEALATELVCVMRYKNHYHTADGIHAEAVAAEFAEHAEEEQEHADMLAERIDQLGGNPNYNPAGLTERSHTDYVECNSLVDMIKENLYAERIAVEIYSEVIRYLGDADPTTRRMLEHILKQEEEHADDMAKFLARLDIGAGLRAERDQQRPERHSAA